MTEISLPAEIGGKDAFQVTNVLILELRKLLSEHCRKKYAPIREIAPILRISGEIADYGAERNENLKFNKRESYVTIDVVVPKSAWTGMEERPLRAYLVTRVVSGIWACAAYLRIKSLPVEDSVLARDLESVRQLYLGRTRS